MNRCNTCKHWQRPENDYGEIPGTGKCNAVVEFWVAAEWDENYEKRDLKPEYANKLAFVKDSSSHFAEMTTSPMFGCVQHESATEKQGSSEFADAHDGRHKNKEEVRK